MDSIATPYARLPEEPDSEEGPCPSGDGTHSQNSAEHRRIQRTTVQFPRSNASSSTAHSTRWFHRTKKSRKTNWLLIKHTGEKRLLYADKRNILQVVLPVEGDRPEELDQFIKALETALSERAAQPTPEQATLTPTLAYSDPDALAFELQVLEIALGEICGRFAQAVESLEQITHPALEDLTQKSDTANLERIRKVKTMHQRLTGRVATVRELIEKYLGDDQDMWRMCLTKKRELDVEGNGQDVFMMQRAMSVAMSVRGSRMATSYQSPFMAPTPLQMHMQQHRRRSLDDNGDKPNAGVDAPGPGPTDSSADYHDLLDVENLLESFLMLIDSSHQKLKYLGDFIDDTEDFINIELGYSRNKLIQVEILITSGTFALAFYGVVAGVLGENLVLPDPIKEDIFGFVFINVGTFCFCCCVFFSIFFFLRRRKLI